MSDEINPPQPQAYRCGSADAYENLVSKLESDLSLKDFLLSQLGLMMNADQAAIKAMADVLENLIEPCRHRTTDDSHIDEIESVIADYDIAIKRARGKK